ncbi:MAG TPA: hypothetical protein PLI18_17350 [Pirellulaceae bacterium]|nr:hypothetical protein [Pirellulaceae bacterium]
MMRSTNRSGRARQGARGMRLFHSSEPPRRCQEDSDLRRGLTRVDLIAIVGCVVALVALAIPLILASRGRARLATCGVRQFRTALAIQQYDLEFQRLPGWRQFRANDASGKALAGSWAFTILPFLTPVGRPVLVTGPQGEREEEGFEPFGLRSGERITPRPGSIAEILDRFGPAGPLELRSGPITAQIDEFICPAAWTDLVRQGPPPTTFLSWQVAAGLPDAPSSVAPPDWPETALFVDRFDPPGPMLFTRLEQVEAWDGINHTILFAEGLGRAAWGTTDEGQVGYVFGWPASELGETTGAADGESEGEGPSESLPATPRFDRAGWLWAGLDRPGVPSPNGLWRRPASRHIEGVNVTYANGATQLIDPAIDPWVWARLTMPHDDGARYPGSSAPVRERAWPGETAAAAPNDSVSDSAVSDSTGSNDVGSNDDASADE